MSDQGLYSKYNVSKVDGSKVDPEAIYFVLRLDTDPHARKAAEAYADSLMDAYREEGTGNPHLAMDIRNLLFKITTRVTIKQAQAGS